MRDRDSEHRVGLESPTGKYWVLLLLLDGLQKYQLIYNMPILLRGKSIHIIIAVFIHSASRRPL